MLSAPYLPKSTRVYAIGDIHGGLRLLKKIMSAIKSNDRTQLKKQTIYLVFLGDYVDRGENSKQVIDYLLTKLPKQFIPIFLKGNHEEMLLSAIEVDTKGNVDSELFNFWYINGGGNTMRSYDKNATDINTRKIFPTAHLAFLENLQLKFELGNYFFCHAGIYPGIDLAEQQASDLLWVRKIFLNSTLDHGKIIVHGHTPCTPLHHGNRIALDHGSVTKGKLACVRLEENGDHEILVVKQTEKWRNG